ncbi:MAG: hypothetical protein O7D93_07310 [Acidobacteria bacterium]|nr:hypothetical protein [Acidobacteriota bacterium]
MKLMIALLLLTQHFISPPADGQEIDLALQDLLTYRELREYGTKKKYRNRMDLFRKVLEARSSLLEQFVHENKMEELREMLLRIRALCPHVEHESSDVKKGSDLRSKQVRKLEIHLRKLVQIVKDLQTVAPVKYAEEFEVTAEALERLRRILLTQVIGYSFSKSGITDSSRTWALQAKRFLDISAPPDRHRL